MKYDLIAIVLSFISVCISIFAARASWRTARASEEELAFKRGLKLYVMPIEGFLHPETRVRVTVKAGDRDCLLMSIAVKNGLFNLNNDFKKSLQLASLMKAKTTKEIEIETMLSSENNIIFTLSYEVLQGEASVVQKTYCHLPDPTKTWDRDGIYIEL